MRLVFDYRHMGFTSIVFEGHESELIGLRKTLLNVRSLLFENREFRLSFRTTSVAVVLRRPAFRSFLICDRSQSQFLPFYCHSQVRNGSA